jgi:hypothetical protein
MKLLYESSEAESRYLDSSWTITRLGGDLISSLAGTSPDPSVEQKKRKCFSSGKNLEWNGIGQSLEALHAAGVYLKSTRSSSLANSPSPPSAASVGSFSCTSEAWRLSLDDERIKTLGLLVLLLSGVVDRARRRCERERWSRLDGGYGPPRAMFEVARETKYPGGAVVCEDVGNREIGQKCIERRRSDEIVFDYISPVALST